MFIGVVPRPKQRYPRTMSYADPITLQAAHAKLEPLSVAHCDEAIVAVRDGALWTNWVTMIPSPETMAHDIRRRLALQSAGTMCPFAVRDGVGRFVGMTSFMNIDEPNHRLEIGSTWFAKAAQGTKLNPEVKRLMLMHAFEVLHCNAVELRTHHMNRQSRSAIEKLGAKLDGILRQHLIMPNGTIRDTAVYSIIASEWPAVKAGLEHRLKT